MNQIFAGLRRSISRVRQPLTRHPKAINSVVSDLFFWRQTNDYQTYFELTCLPALFDDFNNGSFAATLIFFNIDGAQIAETTFYFSAHERKTLNLSELIPKSSGSLGTFSVFHSPVTTTVSSLGSCLVDRGYVSYRYKGSSVRSYTHGNFDAIARFEDHSLELLGSSSIRRRQFNVQLAFQPGTIYEALLVNPTSSKQAIRSTLFDVHGKVVISDIVKLKPRACGIFRYVPSDYGQRLVLVSHLVMARPIIFSLKNDCLDVFHA